MDYPRISIVTPCFNHGLFLEETIRSVIDQGYPNLEYIVIDGGSTDNSVEIIRRYEQHISYWVSEKDNGLYDALNKGFAVSTGDVMGWINSDDLLHRKSLFVIGEIFSQFNEVDWLQGFPTVVDQMGRTVYHRQPRFSRYSFFLKDYRDGIFIQQESTYWRRSLWQKAGATLSNELKYAGDFELWMRFFAHAVLYVTPALIGAFRVHGKTQLSNAHFKLYMDECNSVVDRALSSIGEQDKLQLKKIRRLRFLVHRFGRISKIFKVRRSLETAMEKQKQIVFDLAEQKFMLSSE